MSIELAVLLGVLGLAVLAGLAYGVIIVLQALQYRRWNAAVNRKIDELFGPGSPPDFPTGRHRAVAGGRHQLRTRHA